MKRKRESIKSYVTSDSLKENAVEGCLQIRTQAESEKSPKVNRAIIRSATKETHTVRQWPLSIVGANSIKVRLM